MIFRECAICAAIFVKCIEKEAFVASLNTYSLVSFLAVVASSWCKNFSLCAF